jgi:hypothetical protein
MTSNSAINKPFSIEKRRVYEAYKAVKSIAERLEWTDRPSRCSRQILQGISTRSGIACRQERTFHLRCAPSPFQRRRAAKGRDRVCMTAAMLVLEPIFEADLPPEQYALPRDNQGETVRSNRRRPHPWSVDGRPNGYRHSDAGLRLCPRSPLGPLGSPTTPAARWSLCATPNAR